MSAANRLECISKLLQIANVPAGTAGVELRRLSSDLADGLKSAGSEQAQFLKWTPVPSTGDRMAYAWSRHQVRLLKLR